MVTSDTVTYPVPAVQVLLQTYLVAQTVPVALKLLQMKYSVNINLFPDYRHLLQENYVQYKHIFLLPLLKLVSKTLYHLFIVNIL